MRAPAGVLAVSAIVLGSSLMTVAGQDGAPAGKIWSGVYSTGQGRRAKVPFTGLCRRCHADTLEGSRRGPALKGESFMADWEAQDLRRLLDKIRDTMPPDSPSSLDDSENLDVVTYILQANGDPTAPKDITADMIGDIQLVRAPGSAPRQ